MKTRVLDILGFIPLFLLLLLFRILPLDNASALGGKMGRMIGLRMGISKKARQNLGIAFPHMDEPQKQMIVEGMWDNLGRVVAEYPHLLTIARERVNVRNESIIEDMIKNGKGGILFSAHFGNWEAQVPSLLARHGIGASLTYRALNNPYADNLLRRYRTLGGRLKAFPKARDSARRIMEELKSGGILAILIDQKYNEGIAVDFLGRPAMTNPVFVQLAQRYQVPLVPVCCKRLEGARFEIRVHDPLKLNDENGKALPVETVVREAHKFLEQWITDAPGQWLWLHKRWDSKKLLN